LKHTIPTYSNGVLKLLGIPYKLNNIILSEITNYGPKIHRLDFAAEAIKNGEDICFILECQSQLPNDDDLLRFFKYVSSLLLLKKQKVELYILCMQKTPYDKKEFILNDDCTYTMHVISLKNIKANDIFKRIEGKKYNQITEEDIASLQLIAYTYYEETTLEILKKAFNIIKKLEIKNPNEKEAMIYILNVLSVNMLDEKEYNEFMEETEMILNPRDRYLINKTNIEIAKRMLNNNEPINKIQKYTKLSSQEIENIR
ncbi:MAG: hypothetical protein IJ104_09070, partial [Methanobrevibacter sp.]|nr:hypothetical protein [Methanobrevibacter sp.]